MKRGNGTCSWNLYGNYYKLPAGDVAWLDAQIVSACVKWLIGGSHSRDTEVTIPNLLV